MGKGQEVVEEIRVVGNEVIGQIKELVKKGNVRKIVIKNEAGKPIASFPLTVGVVGVAFAPILSAIGALVAVSSNCTIAVVKRR